MERKSLRELTEFYFQKKQNIQLDYDYSIDKQRKFDIIITQTNSEGKKLKKIGILICDINRSIGLNVLRKIQHMLDDSDEITDAILVGSYFSSQVRKFYKFYDVQIISEAELIETPTVWPLVPAISASTEIVVKLFAGTVKIPLESLKLITPEETEAASVNLVSPLNK